MFLIVKENHSDDQLIGDTKQGNGEPPLTQFGQKVTPNQHALATQFGLYDNTYDIGTNSAEGQNWLMQGDNPAYSETSARSDGASVGPGARVDEFDGPDVRSGDLRRTRFRGAIVSDHGSIRITHALRVTCNA